MICCSLIRGIGEKDNRIVQSAAPAATSGAGAYYQASLLGDSTNTNDKSVETKSEFTTLAMGSSDAGRTILSRDPVLTEMVRVVCEQTLNLKPHNVIDGQGQTKMIWGPAGEYLLIRGQPDSLNP